MNLEGVYLPTRNSRTVFFGTESEQNFGVWSL